MKPYYEDDSVTLYHGDSLEILPTLDVEANVLLTDPPYFKVKQDEWDNQWDKASEFLAWMGDFLDRAKPLLTANASTWVFASPAMTSSVERLVGERFRVLNSIRWVKEQGWHQKAEVAALRSYLTPWEGIVFAEQSARSLGAYMQAERVRAGATRRQLAELFPSETGGLTGCIRNWEGGLGEPSKEAYSAIRSFLGKGFLEAEYDSLRRPFHIKSRATSTDVWTFQPLRPDADRHPCEKPQSMLRHMIETSSRPGDLILDAFAGSGSTLDAARQTGRRAVGIEQDERWCEYIAKRLSQEVFDFGLSA